MLKSLSIFTGNANRALADEICKFVEISACRADVTHFSDGEIYVEVGENVRGVNCFVVQPTCSPPNQSLMELLIMIDALKRASAGSIVAIVPYFGYARQDRKAKPRTPITAKLVANLITAAGADRALAMDLHAGQIQGFFDIPFDHLYGMPVLIEELRVLGFGGDQCVVVSPDAGGVERARAFSKRLGASLAIIDKRRPAPNVSEVMNIVGDVRGKKAVIVDDIIDTAGTLTSAASADHERRRHERLGVLQPPGVLGQGGPADHRVAAPARDRDQHDPAVGGGSAVSEGARQERRPVTRRGDQAHSSRGFDQLAVRVMELRKESVMEVGKLTVSICNAAGKGAVTCSLRRR